MFKQLQQEHSAWALKNFGKQDIEDYKLGLIEEVGELAHAVLKRKQGIRNTEDHDANIRDAIGDITIYLVGFCTACNKKLTLNYCDLFIGHKRSITQCITTISLYANGVIISNCNDETRIIQLIHELKQFCFNESIDYEQTVKETWVSVVSKRDWKNNPDQIAAERLEDYCDKGCPV